MAANGSEKAFCVLTFQECQSDTIVHKGCTYRATVRYVTKTWNVVLLNKKYINPFNVSLTVHHAMILGNCPT